MCLGGRDALEVTLFGSTDSVCHEKTHYIRKLLPPSFAVLAVTQLKINPGYAKVDAQPTVLLGLVGE